jgi:predicted transcriptional regulator
VSVKLPARDEILETIRKNPGIHFRAVQRETGFATGQVEYHLYQLEKEELITVRKDGRFKRYFLYSTGDPVSTKLGFHIRIRCSREIIFTLLRKGSSDIEDFSLKCGKNPSQFLKEMENDGLIVKEGNNYRLFNPDAIKQAIKKSKKSYLEELAESLIDFLDEGL